PERSILLEREVRTDPVIVGGISRQDPAQMRFAEHHDMVKAFTSDRADEAFDMAVLPRRAGRDWSVPDTHRSEPLCDDHAIGIIPIADEVSRCLVPGECLGDLLCNPLGCRVSGDIGPDKLSAPKAQ